jgi:hypothetical protein
MLHRYDIRCCIWAGFLGLLAFSPVFGQSLRFSNHREVAIPEYAVLKIGPFYSAVTFEQSAGYRYTRSTGTGTDFLFDNKRGVIQEDGSEFPIVSSLNFRNYLLITRRTDLDVSIKMSYAHYPMETQEDEFVIDLAEENISAAISSELNISPFLKGTISDNAEYRTDYIDIRGQGDEYGGQGYERFSNELGLDMDWLVTRSQNIAFSGKRLDEIPRDDDFVDQEKTAYEESLAYEYEVLPGIVVGAKAAFLQTLYAGTNRQDTLLSDYSVFLGGSKGLGIKLTEFTTVSAELGLAHGSDWSGSLTNEAANAATVSTAISLNTELSKQLSHLLTYSRGLRTGFESDFETHSDFDYRLQWAGDVASASFASTISSVEPSGANAIDYSDWSSSAQLRYPVAPFLTLVFSTSYDVRDNAERVVVENQAVEDAVDGEQAAVSAPISIEAANDYATWSSRVGTSFSLLEGLDFSVYVQHVVRISDSTDLEYERDTVSATFTYRHEF